METTVNNQVANTLGAETMSFVGVIKAFESFKDSFYDAIAMNYSDKVADEYFNNHSAQLDAISKLIYTELGECIRQSVVYSSDTL